MTHINNLPFEILVKIFLEFLKTESQLNLIQRVAKTCVYWSYVCKDTSLWSVYDGSLSFHTLKVFSERGYLKNVEIFYFCQLQNVVKQNDLKSIYSNLPKVKCINFTNAIKKLEKKQCYIISELHDQCPDLNEIIINERSESHDHKLSYKLFENFIDFRGPKLVSLDFSNIHLVGVKNLFLIIASSCMNLVHLKAQNLNIQSGNHFFPIENMQEGLQKLKTLCLGLPIILKSNKSSLKSEGFPSLEIFTHPSNFDIYLHDFCFKKLLQKSPNLKVLDIRGCKTLTVEALCTLSTPNLERLYVSHTRLYESLNFIDVLRKWGHSLEALDISRLKGNAINDHFSSIITSGNLRNLESLDINNTAVTVSTVKLIIQNCLGLKFLQLESCRELNRGYKRPYKGKTALKELLLKLDDSMDTT